MKYDYNGVFISMQTIITLHFLRFAKSMSKWYTHVNAFYQYVLPVIDDKQGISNLLSKLSNVLSRFWWSSWYSFQKIHIPNHRFWQHIRKDMYANEYPWTEVTKIERETMLVHDKKDDTSIMLGTVNIFYSFEIEYVISKFLISINIVQSKCVRCATYQPINNEMVNEYHSMDCLCLVFRAVIDASHVTLQNKWYNMRGINARWLVSFVRIVLRKRTIHYNSKPSFIMRSS